MEHSLYQAHNSVMYQISIHVCIDVLTVTACNCPIECEKFMVIYKMKVPCIQLIDLIFVCSQTEQLFCIYTFKNITDWQSGTLLGVWDIIGSLEHYGESGTLWGVWNIIGSLGHYYFSQITIDIYYTPHNKVVPTTKLQGGILVSPCPSIRPSVDKSYVVR